MNNFTPPVPAQPPQPAQPVAGQHQPPAAAQTNPPAAGGAPAAGARQQAYSQQYGGINPAHPSEEILKDLGISKGMWYQLAQLYNRSNNPNISTRNLVATLFRHQAEGIPYEVMGYIPIPQSGNRTEEIWTTDELYTFRAQRAGNLASLTSVLSETRIEFDIGGNNVINAPEWAYVEAVKMVGGVPHKSRSITFYARDVIPKIRNLKAGSAWHQYPDHMLTKRARKQILKTLYPTSMEANPGAQVELAQASLLAAQAHNVGGVPLVDHTGEEDAGTPDGAGAPPPASPVPVEQQQGGTVTQAYNPPQVVQPVLQNPQTGQFVDASQPVPVTPQQPQAPQQPAPVQGNQVVGQQGNAAPPPAPPDPNPRNDY